MANRIKIQLIQNPAPFSYINFLATAIGLPPYFAQIAKTFVPGTPTADYHVKIGSDLNATIANFYQNLVEISTTVSYYFTLEGSAIYLNFYQDRGFNLSHNPASWYVLTLETQIIPVPETIDPLILSSFQIEIIDTYENERILIEELTSIGSPKLTYDSGDDIFEPFMNSTLEFNILDLEAQDAKFYHLFTGDENRYLVKLSNVDSEENIQLIWQGFLLPDQYSEPYKNGIVPVNFTAIDMISTLKGKYLDPWIYYQKFTLPEFFSMAMSFTGLDQDFIVKPSIVSVAPNVKWQNIIVSLEPYIESGKYTDIYKIVEDILISQCLTMKSYRGYWWLEGITRKGELSGPAIKIKHDNSASENLEITKSVVAPMNSAGSVNFRAITPFKNVAVNFDYDQQSSLYPDDILLRDGKFLGYNTDSFDETTPVNTNFRQWIKTGGNEIMLLNPTREFSFGLNPQYPGASYNNSMASSYANYFDAPVKPFLKAGLNYEIELEIILKTYHTAIVDGPNFQEHLNAGDWDSLLMFQMIVDGYVIRSNAPGSPTEPLNKFDERTYNGSKSPDYSALGHIYAISFKTKFKIKREFSVGQDGNLTFRFLKPYGNSSFPIHAFDIYPQILKVTVLDGNENESIKALRDVNFTQSKNVDLPITSSVNGGIKNSFSIGSRMGNQEMLIPIGTQQLRTFNQVFPPLNNLLMTTSRFTITNEVSELLFDRNKTKSLFLEKFSGQKIHFFSVYTLKENGLVKLYYLRDFQGRPFKPKDYVKLPLITAGDKLKIKLSNFTNENYSQREFWHVHGFPEWVENYPKTVANVYHSVRKEPSFGLETTVLFLMLPDNLLNFYFAGQNRNFIPTRLELDLSNGKTTVNLKEATLNQINDISYE